jgi:type I restriction enzyme S subunit
MIMLRVNESAIDPRYLNWQLATPEPQAYLNACKSGMAEAQMNFANEDLLSMEIFLPPLDEQRRIADFLDTETTRIDALSRAREAQVALLSERHTSLLVRLVSGSGEEQCASSAMHPADRGILSEPAPDRWSLLSLRRIMQKLNRPTRSSDTVVTAYRDGEVTLRSNRREGGYTFSDTETGYQGVEPGDLVFHALDGFAGAVGISDSRGKASPVYHVCAVRGYDDARFMSFALRAMGMLGYLEIQAGNVRQRSVDFRSWETFARLPMPRPPLHEQQRIAEMLAESHAWSEKVASVLNHQLSLLAERRQALITAAVTGQVDATTARPLVPAGGAVT